MSVKLGNALFIIWGCLIGYALALDSILPTLKNNTIHFSQLRTILVLAGPASATLLFLIRKYLRNWIGKIEIPPSAKIHYLKYDSFTYLAFGMVFLLGIGFRISVPTIYLVIITFLIFQGICLFWGLQKTKPGSSIFSSFSTIGFLFLVSGMAALMYEIIWQRTLFSAYGINIESITIIVSLFMFGLGLGSLGGGILSRRYPLSLPYLFVGCELIIGLFGVISLPLMDAIANHTFNLGMPGITLTMYAMLSLPTFFMGATLPILVTLLHQRNDHIGNSVSLLYFFNTLGSAFACFITVDLLFVFFGKQATVWIAASLNLLAASSVYFLFRQKKDLGIEPPPSYGDADQPVSPVSTLPFFIILIIAALVGLISLSQELLWVRVISYNAQGAPQVFGQILGCFLLGIALGSRNSKKYCLAEKMPLTTLSGFIFSGSVLFYVATPLVANLSLLGKGIGLIGSYLLVGITAYLFGHILPILCHYGITAGKHVGIRLSWIYVANILGSTGGPLLTGFVFMEYFPLAENIRFVAWLGLFLALGMYWFSNRKNSMKMVFSFGIGLCALFMVVFNASFFGRYLEKMHFGSKYSSERNYIHLLQNRSGILAVRCDARGDIIFGGGAYDGRFNLDPIQNSNGIRRVFQVASLHPKPTLVLEIGLSSGSWAKIIASHSKVEKLDIVEINPGYGKLINEYPENRSILSDPKIHLHIDDGRRWLKRNPNASFDFILMNTTFHWRSNSTNLLSREFLELAKQHLLPGGVIYYNTTESRDVIRTAAEVFKHVVVYSTFVAASDSPFSMSTQERAAALLNFSQDHHALLDTLNPKVAKAWLEMANAALPDLSKQVREDSLLKVISDDNMLTEFKQITDTDAIGYLYRVFNPERKWRLFLGNLRGSLAAK